MIEMSAAQQAERWWLEHSLGVGLALTIQQLSNNHPTLPTQPGRSATQSGSDRQNADLD